MISFSVDASKLERQLAELSALLEPGEIGRVFSRGTGYEEFVQAAAHQARIHQGVWQTDEDAVREFEETFTAAFEKHVREINGGGALGTRKYIRQTLEEMTEWMRRYPPPRSAYQRTNELHDSWTYEMNR